jgi:tagatose 6-phosphate kinase
VIVAVTLNAALDKTYRVDELILGTAHRVGETHVQAGGKGVNVARALARAGVPVLAIGVTAGLTGQQIEQDLELAGVKAAMYRVEGESRQTVTAVSRRQDAWIEFDERGPQLSPNYWPGFLDWVGTALEGASVVVISGSLPPGTPIDAYRRLVEVSHSLRAQVVLDSAGPAFEMALAAGPDVVTPNRSELAGLLGSSCNSLDEVVTAGHALGARGARTVVATLGADGAVAVTGTQVWQARHPVRSGNPVGAGDALVAGIAKSLADGASLVDTLRLGCAWALASLNSPWAGHVEQNDVVAALPQVLVDQLADLIGDEKGGQQ